MKTVNYLTLLEMLNICDYVLVQRRGSWGRSRMYCNWLNLGDYEWALTDAIDSIKYCHL